MGTKKGIHHGVIAVFLVVALLASFLAAIPVAQASPDLEVVCVPWRGDEGLPHPTLDATEVSLKGTVRYPGEVSWEWDFGDGSIAETGTVTATDEYPFPIVDVRHAYSGPPGSLFVAVLTVSTNGEEESDTYLVEIKEASLEVEADIAVDEGLWWLYQKQVRELRQGEECGYWQELWGEGPALGNRNPDGEGAEVILQASPPIDPLTPLTDPVCTSWHELWPWFCNEYHLADWEDWNEDGVLSPGDDIELEGGVPFSWYYVDYMTVGILVSKKPDLTEFMYLGFDGDHGMMEEAISAPVCTYWVEIYPQLEGEFLEYHLAAWEDTNADGALSACDQILLEYDGIEAWYHVDEVTIDIVVFPYEAGGYRVGYTGGATQAFENNLHKPFGDPTKDPYVDCVRRGLNYLTSMMRTVEIPPDDPYGGDTNGNGFGISCYDWEMWGVPMYEVGIAMMAVVSSDTPGRVAVTGPPDVIGRTYQEIMQDMADYCHWAQNEGGDVSGGWRYEPNYSESDNSVTQWPIMGLVPAEAKWGITIADFVRPRLLDWLTWSQCHEPGPLNGGFGYTDPCDWVNIAKTAGTGVTGLLFCGVPEDDPRIVDAVDFIDINWFDDYEHWGSLYAGYGVMKAFSEEYLDMEVTPGGHNWWNEYAEALVANQNADGSWSDGGGWVQDQLATAWSVLILTRALFDIPPTAVAKANGFDATEVDMDQVVNFDGSQSRDGSYHIVKYEWDWESDGIYDYESPDPTATHAYLAYNGFTVTLRVTDNRDVMTGGEKPAMTDTDTCLVAVHPPPHPPIADADGPYIGWVCTPVTLDGSGSWDPNEPWDDYIAAWEWDLDNDGEFDDASGEIVEWHWAEPGIYPIALMVWDSSGAPCTEPSRTIVEIGNHDPVADANGPYSTEPCTPVTLDGSASYDPDPEPDHIVSWEWDLDNDGEYDDATGEFVDFHRDVEGAYTVRLKVTDTFGATGTDSTSVTVEENLPPEPLITTPEDGATLSGVVRIEEIDLTGEDDIVSNTFEYWYDTNQNCEPDDEGSEWLLIGVDENGEDGWWVDWDTGEVPEGCYIIQATMLDKHGLTGSDTVNVTVVTIVEDTEPPQNKPGYPRLKVGEQNPDGTYQVTITDKVIDEGSGVKRVIAKVDGNLEFEADDIGLPEYEFSFVVDLYPGYHELTIEAWDVAGNHLDKHITTVIPNEPPIAVITRTYPNPAEEGEEVFFRGYGKDPDGWVMGYNWRSSIDGQLSTARCFSTTSLSLGEHIIYLQVIDDKGAWSEEATKTLIITPVVPNEPPIAVITRTYPNPAEEGEEVFFRGFGRDPDGWVMGYNWRSSIDGQLSTERCFSTISLSLGEHIIYFKVTDNEGAWSAEVSETLIITSED